VSSLQLQLFHFASVPCNYELSLCFEPPEEVKAEQLALELETQRLEATGAQAIQEQLAAEMMRMEEAKITHYYGS
jgi:hypothetical protein